MPSRLPLRLLLLVLATGLLAHAAPAKRPSSTPANPADTPAQAAEAVAPTEPVATTDPAAPETAPALPPVNGWLEIQVELHRRGFSCGSIDGVGGPQTVQALRAFQRSAGLDETGKLDAPTKEVLLLQAPATTEHTITVTELAGLQPLADTWLGKSEQTALAYATALEALAEQSRASPRLLQRLNPDVKWDDLLPGTTVTVPAVGPVRLAKKAALLHIRLADRVMQATDPYGELIAQFPVSIAKKVEKRPVGQLVVTVVIPDPNYTMDPDNFPESEEMQALGRKLILPPGPNNPVGVAWIGIDRPGYGLHGTPDPEKIGRTESHGCFRLANWDARALLDIAWPGLPVVVEP